MLPHRITDNGGEHACQHDYEHFPFQGGVGLHCRAVEADVVLDVVEYPFHPVLGPVDVQDLAGGEVLCTQDHEIAQFAPCLIDGLGVHLEHAGAVPCLAYGDQALPFACEQPLLGIADRKLLVVHHVRELG